MLAGASCPGIVGRRISSGSATSAFGEDLRFHLYPGDAKWILCEDLRFNFHRGGAKWILGEDLHRVHERTILIAPLSVAAGYLTRLLEMRNPPWRVDIGALECIAVESMKTLAPS